MRRSAAFGFVAVGLLGSLQAAGAAPSTPNHILSADAGSRGRATWNLTGTWHGSGGNTLSLTQHGTTVTWVAKGAGRAWVHDFTGRIAGNTISGTFQDRPGFSLHNHGSLKLRIVDDCHLVVVHVEIDGFAPSSGGERFAKTPCATVRRPAPRFSVLTRGDPAVGKKTLFPSFTGTKIAGSGSFVQRATRLSSAVGTIAVEHDYLAIPDQRITLKPTGEGSYLQGKGRVYLRMKVKVTKSTATGCSRGRTGQLLLLDVQGGADAVQLAVCGDRLVYKSGSPHGTIVNVSVARV